MLWTLKSKKPGRGERHSAAWGKRLSILALVLIAEVAFAQRPEMSSARGETLRAFGRIAPELSHQLALAHQGAAGTQTVKVIVEYKSIPQSAHFAKMQSLGGRLHAQLHVVRAASFTIPVRALAALEADPDVVSVTIDHALNGMDDYTDAASNVSAAWNSGYDGTGIGVAVIDSGINDSHPDLQDATQSYSRVLYHQDFTGTATSNSSGARNDLYGHGTHVAGIIGGNGYLSGGRLSGVAPNVNLIDLRALDANGSGSDSTVIAAIDQAIALKNTYNIRVINLSLGRGIPVGYAQDPLCQAVEAAWQSGIVVVVAAGNYGRLSVYGSNGFGTITAPGNDPLVLTVGAMKSMGTYPRTDDQIASYSSKGPTTYDHVVKPDIMADGNQVVSLAAQGATLEGAYPADLVADNHGHNNYLTLSGTSMATPAVAGAVALLLQQNSALTPDQVKARLMKTAYKVFPTSTVARVPHLYQNFTEFYDLFSVGSGYLDLQAALANTDVAPATVGSALSPSVVYNSSNGTVSLVNGNSTILPGSVVWGSSVVWGTSVVWGANVTGSSVVWGTALPWNSSSLNAFSVVWGASTGSTSATSVVWGASLLNGNSAFTDAGDDEN
jgi:serine protease AprX